MKVSEIGKPKWDNRQSKIEPDSFPQFPADPRFRIPNWSGLLGKKRNQTEKWILEQKLRDEAEEKLAWSPGPTAKIQERTPEEVIRELQVYQIELEMQNEELRKAQLALEESRQRYANLYDFAPVGYFTFTREALIKEMNLAGATLLGVVRQKLNNRRFRWHVAPSDFDLWDRHFLSVLQQGEKQTCELTLKRQDGSPFFAGLESIRIEVSRGEFEVHTAVTDVTERKQAEEMLRMSKDYLDNIINATGYPIFVKDDSFRFTLVNNALCVMLGIERENIIGKTLGESLPEDQMEHFLKVDKMVLDSGLENQCEELLTGSGGNILNIVTKKTRFVDEKGNNFLVGVIYDITEHKQDQEKLSQTLENLRKALGGIIQVISATVETRDPYTAGHQRRVADLAWAIAEKMEISDNQRDGLRMAGIIHDLGKIAVPAEILSKPTKLTEIETKLIRVHSQVGYDILKDIDFPWPLADMVLQHHERMNGSGYPQGLKGKEICLEAKILMVADVVEAMASYRPYRPALGIEAALEEIEKNKGILYDPEVVEVCLGLFREKGFHFE